MLTLTVLEACLIVEGWLLSWVLSWEGGRRGWGCMYVQRLVT